MSDDLLDSASCLDRVAAGDEEAARELIDRLAPLVLKIARKYKPFRNDEEDLVQAIFIKVFSKLSQFSGNVPLEHWVSRIAVNTCLNEIDRQRVRPELRYADLSEEQQEVIEKLHSNEELDPSQTMASAEVLEQLLECLSPEDRMVVRMLYVDGDSIKDIQRVTGWSSPMVRIRAFRARAKLKNSLEKLRKAQLRE